VRLKITDPTGLTIEVLASISTLFGIFLGSTTLEGSVAYAVSLVFWYWLTVRRRMWGLMPLNIGSSVVTAWNFASAKMPDIPDCCFRLF
jgi:hypothetical protein